MAQETKGPESPSIIRIEAGDNSPGARLTVYVYVGPFDTFDLAAEWLNKNGFEQHRPNLWLFEGEATFDYYGRDIKVKSLRAWVSELKTPQKSRFKCLRSSL